jgi:ubiquinone biosynthesis protein
MRHRIFERFNRNRQRFEDIAKILAKYGFAGWLNEDTHGFFKKAFEPVIGEAVLSLSFEERVRMALTELGTTFIKLGQMLSTRSDIVGDELAEELSKLQSDTPANPPDIIHEIVERELGKPLDEIFTSFDLNALASASIGQVHLAELSQGQKVVVKVQHPGIEKIIKEDLDILAGLAHLAEKGSSELRLFQPRRQVAEFTRNLLRELDFKREARNLQVFAENFSNDEHLHFPIPYTELSTARILTMEQLDGFSVADHKKLEESGIDTMQFLKDGCEMYLDMIFRDGQFHADPHPGNIFALPGGVIGLLDFGMVGRVSRHMQDDLEELLLSCVEKNAEKVVSVILRMSTVPAGLDKQSLEVEIDDMLAEYVGLSIKDFDFGSAMMKTTEIIRKYHIIIPPGFSLLTKVLVQLEGTCRQIDNRFNFAELLEPYYTRSLINKFSPEKFFRRFQSSYKDWERLLDILPKELYDILKRIGLGEYDVNLRHRGINIGINRMVYGMLASSLLLGSTLLISREIKPLFQGFSIIGGTGLFVSLSLSLRLILAIKKSGGL